MKSFTYSVLIATLLMAPSFVAADVPVANPLMPQILDPLNAFSERVTSFEEALIRAKSTGKDIAVFQYGSDWNPASLSLFQNAWSKDALLRNLGPGFVVVAIDQPENNGSRGARMRLEKLSKTPSPGNDVVEVVSEGGVVFDKRADGAFIAQASKNPVHDTLQLKLKPAHSGTVLRLDFPIDNSLPNGGPGRTANGNAVISEVEVMQGGRRVIPKFAWANNNQVAHFGPRKAVDGISDKTGEGWNLTGGERQPRTLLLGLEDSVMAGQDLIIKLVCRSQWSQHVPGCMRAVVIDDDQVLKDIRDVGRAQALKDLNRQFSFTGWGKMPRLSLFDADGRPVGADHALPIHLTPKQFSDKIKTMRTRREKRDALWVQSESADGVAKAELLRQSLDSLNLGRDREFGLHNGWGTQAGGPYEPVLQAIKSADPQDQSGAIRWAGFSHGAWGALLWAPTNQWRTKLDGKPDLTDADYAEAEACIDRELSDPRNKVLENDAIQHIMKARYDLYLQQFKGDHIHPKILEVQRQIAKLDPDTFWGVGAVGYLGMHRRSEQPFIVYGFNAKYQAKPGSNTWLLADAWKDVDHAGAYRFTVTYAGGKDAIKITRMAVIVNDKEVAVGKPSLGSGLLGPSNRTVEIPFNISALDTSAKAIIQVNYEASGEALELSGGFGVEPLLVE